MRGRNRRKITPLIVPDEPAHLNAIAEQSLCNSASIRLRRLLLEALIGRALQPIGRAGAQRVSTRHRTPPEFACRVRDADAKVPRVRATAREGAASRPERETKGGGAHAPPPLVSHAALEGRRYFDPADEGRLTRSRCDRI